MNKIEEILKNLELNENERKIFLASLRIGLAPISQVAREAGLGRTYAYELVEQLKEKGLLAETEEKGVRKIETLDYEGVLAYIGRKQRDMEIVARALIRSEKDFKAARAGVPSKTKVRFFEGVEGIKSINSEIRKDLEKLRHPYKFHVVFSADRMESVLPGWIEQNQHIYYEPHMRKYAIVSGTPLLQKFMEQVRNREQRNFFSKIWPSSKTEFPTDTLCWLDKLAYLDMEGHPSGIIIQNKAIADTFVMWFEQMWTSLR